MARGPTAAEFREFIRDAYAEWLARRAGTAWAGEEPIWSWDNPVIHGVVGKGEWAKPGADGTPKVTKLNHTMLPKYSPDMHNVIENTHSIICKALQRFVNQNRPAAGDTLQK